jgi:outer membrane assembly lipoprotein YfiO
MMRIVPVVLMVIVLTGCSKKSAEEMFAAGEEAQALAEEALGEEAQDSLFRLAISNFNAVVEDYPDHPIAEPALFRVAELHSNGTRRFLEAIDTYRRFRAVYQNSPQAPVSLFMIGFLYNNELGQYEKAAAAYTEFLENYPDHELAPSASAELAFLGKSPEEIIEQQMADIKGENGKPSPAGGPMTP